MKKSSIVIEHKNKKEEFRVLMKVEMNEKEYVIYTDDTTDDSGETIAYTGSYEFIDGHQIIKPIDDSETLEFLDSILLHIQSVINKNEKSE